MIFESLILLAAVTVGGGFWFADRQARRREDQRLDAEEKAEREAEEERRNPPTLAAYVPPAHDTPCPRCGLHGKARRSSGGLDAVMWGIVECDCKLRVPHVHAMCTGCNSNWLMAPRVPS